MASSGGVRSEVAVKILRADIDPSSDAVKRLRDEGRLLGALRHPAILRVHDLVLLEGRVALVTEYVEGQDLDGCLQGDQPMQLRALVAVVGEVAAALHTAWTAPAPESGEPVHLVHRDVKPANIRIGKHGEVKLLDFGIARATNVDREAQTANNAMMGSYLYMAPERFHEDGVEPPSDLYALGCVLFEGLIGNRFFEGRTLKQIYGTMLSSRKFKRHRKRRFDKIPDDMPEAVVVLLRSMLEPDPDDRPGSAEVARLCEDLVEDLSGPTLKRWARRRTWPAPDHEPGFLEGRDLSVQSFVTTDPGPERDRSAETWGPGQADAAPDLSSSSFPDDADGPETAVESAPAVEPVPHVESSHGAVTNSALPPIHLMALPSPGGATALDAPLPRLRTDEVDVAALAAAAEAAAAAAVAAAAAAAAAAADAVAADAAAADAQAAAEAQATGDAVVETSDKSDATVDTIPVDERVTGVPVDAPFVSADAPADASSHEAAPVAPAATNVLPERGVPPIQQPVEASPPQAVSGSELPDTVAPVGPEVASGADANVSLASVPTPAPLMDPAPLASLAPPQDESEDGLEGVLVATFFGDVSDAPDPSGERYTEVPAAPLPPPPGEPSTPAARGARAAAQRDQTAGNASYVPINASSTPSPIPGVLDDSGHQDLGGFGGADESDDLEPYLTHRSRGTSTVVLGIVALLLLLGLAGGVGWAMSEGMFEPGGRLAFTSEEPEPEGIRPGTPSGGADVARATVAPSPTVAAAVPSPEPTPASPKPTPVPSRPTPSPVSPPRAVPSPNPTAAPVVAPAPTAPAAPPAPAAPAPKPAPSGASASALRDRGWNTMDRDLAAAAELFQQALALDPKHPDGVYGYGYSLWKQGQTTQALPFLCQAQATGDTSIKREVKGLLEKGGERCD